MANIVKNSRRPHLVPRAWRMLRVAAKPRGNEEAQLRLKIGELEEMIVGVEEKEARKRASGLLPPERNHNVRADMPMRHAERQAMYQQRIREWLVIAIIALGVVICAAWLYFRLQVIA